MLWLTVLSPAVQHEGELAARDQLLCDVAALVVLLVPPPLEEGLLGEGEAPVGVHLEALDDGVEGVADAGVLEIVSLAVEVLVDRLEPADIVVRVGDQVHIELSLVGARTARAEALGLRAARRQ